MDAAFGPSPLASDQRRRGAHHEPGLFEHRGSEIGVVLRLLAHPWFEVDVGANDVVERLLRKTQIQPEQSAPQGAELTLELFRGEGAELTLVLLLGADFAEAYVLALPHEGRVGGSPDASGKANARR
jgi:hypothetical protein